MLQHIRSTDTVTNDGVKGIIYGKAGTGKTMLAYTAPYPLVIATEPGLLSLKGANTPYIFCETVGQLAEVAQWLIGSHEPRQRFQTIMFDSLTEVLEIILAEERPKAGKEPRRAYNELLIKATDLMKTYRDLKGFHMFFTAKQSREKDGETGAMIYGPDFPGQKLGTASTYLFDFVFQLGVHIDPVTQVRTRLLRCQPDNQYEAKDRSGRLAPFEPANLTAILQKVM